MFIPFAGNFYTTEHSSSKGNRKIASYEKKRKAGLLKPYL
jgi:hypothetical protein